MRGFPNDQLQRMAEDLEPGHSMFVMLSNADEAENVESILRVGSGEIISHPLSAELHADFEHATDEMGEQVFVIKADETTGEAAGEAVEV